MPTLVKQADFVTFLERTIRNDTHPRHIRLQEEEGHFVDVLDRAIEKYSVEEPYVRKYSQAGDNVTFEFTLDTIIGAPWKRGFSYVKKIRLASTDATEREEDFLDPSLGDYEIIENTDDPPKSILRLLNRTPSNTETLDIWYTTTHTMPEATETSIPPMSRMKFMDLAAYYAYCLMAEAAASTLDGDTDETVQADLSEKYRKLAEERYAKYEGSEDDDETPKPVGTFASIVTNDEQGEARFSHNLRTGER